MRRGAEHPQKSLSNNDILVFVLLRFLLFGEHLWWLARDELVPEFIVGLLLFDDGVDLGDVKEMAYQSVENAV